MATGKPTTSKRPSFVMTAAIAFMATAIRQAGGQSATVPNSYPSRPPTAYPGCRLDNDPGKEYPPRPGGCWEAEVDCGFCSCDESCRTTCHPPSCVFPSGWGCAVLGPRCCAACSWGENCQLASGETMPVGRSVEKDGAHCCSCRQDERSLTLEMVCHVPVPEPQSTVEAKENDPERRLRKLNTRPRQLAPKLPKAEIIRSRQRRFREPKRN